MRVRCGGLVGIACIAAAVVFGLLVLPGDRVSFVGAMTPVAFLGFGIAVLTRPYAIVDEHAVVVKALRGPRQERYDLGAADLVAFDGPRVFLVNASGRRRLRGVTGWLANRHDWEDFRAWATRRRGERAKRGI